MTQQATEAPATSVNGSGPVPPDAPCEDCATTPEKVMAAVGLLLAAALAAVAIDLITGGALTRAAARLTGTRDDASG